MAGERAFVTGGSGFIGGALIRRLARDGWQVHALARSESSEAAVAGAGAVPVRGDLGDVAAMTEGARGCEYFFHSAAAVDSWGDRDEFERINVQGTRNALSAASEAGVRRFVHVGTEAALMAGQPLVNVDETAPLRPDSPAIYPSTKAKAEQAVRDANRAGFETVVVRPRFVWGAGDTSVLPAIVDAVESGRFAWIGGGKHVTATTHVGNTVEGLVLGAIRGRPGGVYFVTDGDPVVFRDFVSDLLRTQGIEPPGRSLPAGLAKAMAGAGERLMKKKRPPLSRFDVWVSSQECTIDIARARDELGYEPVVTREDGLRELAAAGRAEAA